MTGCFHDDYDSRHTEQVRHDVGDNGQVDQSFELFIQRWADGHQREERLNDGDSHHAADRCAMGGDLFQECREVAFVSTSFEYIGNGELPAKERTEAGENHEAHDDTTDGRSEHRSEYETERSGAGSQFFCRNDTENDVGRNDVAGSCEECTAENGFRYVGFRVVDSVCVRAGRFHAEECPECHRDRIDSRFTESQVMNIPVCRVQGWREPEPADDCKADTWDDDAPDGDGRNLTGVFSAAKVQDSRQPECEDSRRTGHDRIKRRSQEPQRIPHR